LLDWISGSVPGAVQVDGNDVVYLALTATPLPPTPWLVATETAFPTLTESAAPPTATAGSSVAIPTTIPPTKTPTATNPICGSAALTFPALAGVIWIARRRK
jgi:hypothetical protein